MLSDIRVELLDYGDDKITRLRLRWADSEKFIYEQFYAPPQKPDLFSSDWTWVDNPIEGLGIAGKRQLITWEKLASTNGGE